MTTWYYVEDGEWPEECVNVSFSCHWEKDAVVGYLIHFGEGEPPVWVRSSDLDHYELADVYAWAELPEKAPVREKINE